MARADPVENPNWKFGQKAPVPDTMLLAAVHNIMHKNSLSSMHDMKHKGITNPDFEAAFLGGADDENIAELFEEMSEMEFEKPDLRAVKRNIGRDPELFEMLMGLPPSYLQ